VNAAGGLRHSDLNDLW